MKHWKRIGLPLVLAVILLSVGLAAAEEDAFVPTVLPAERFEELAARTKGSDDKNTQALRSVLVSNYKRVTVSELLMSENREERYLGVHLLRMSVPNSLTGWVQSLDPEFPMTQDELALAAQDTLRADLLAQEFRVCLGLHKNAKDALLKLLYGDDRRKGIGYTRGEGRMDSIWCLDELPPPPVYLVRRDGTAVFNHCDKDAAECEIRSEYEGHPVTAIGKNAFSQCAQLTHIRIPETVASIEDSAFSSCIQLSSVQFDGAVKSIGKDAFGNCISLENITLPEGLEEIGVGAFFGCISLKSIVLPEGLTQIGFAAFIGCPALEEVTIPGTIKEVQRYMFYADASVISRYLSSNGHYVSTVSPYFLGTNLTRVTLGDGVETIEDYAFQDCENLTVITIPNSLSSIGPAAFSRCRNLKDIRLSPDHPTFTLSDHAIIRKTDGCLITVLYAPAMISYTIPDGVRSIGARAFSCCPNLTAVTIPDSVEIIGDFAFYGSELLTDMTIPDSVTVIGDSAFSACLKLSGINIPESVTSIGAFAFNSCLDLTGIAIPAGVTTIGENAFHGCWNLTVTVTPGSYAEAWCRENGVPFISGGGL